jgi:putative two-component system response regulator
MDTKRIMIVEDERLNALYLSKFLTSLGYSVLEIVPSGEMAISLAIREKPDIILMDIMLEGEIDGIDAAMAIHKEGNTPIIFISAYSDDKLVERAQKVSPYGYIMKPFEKRNLSTVLSLSLHRSSLEKKLNDTINQLKTILSGALHAIAKAVEFRDPYTAGHQRRVGDLSRAIALKMGLSEDVVETVYIAATIHDIGKISIPAEILSKPTTLNEAEYQLIKGHPATGFEILNQIELPPIFSRIVFQHHERMDGSGYPSNLMKDDIALESRIVSVSDVVESMSSHRPYRPALGKDLAFQEIIQNRGILYDKDVVDACMSCFNEGGFVF